MPSPLAALAAFAVLSLAVVSWPGASAHAEPWRLATGNDYRPFTDDSLPEGGMVTEIVRAAFAQQKTAVSIEFLPWERGRRATEAGRFAGAFPYVTSPARRAVFHYSDPIWRFDNVAFVRADSDWAAKRVAQIPAGTYCYPRGYAEVAATKARRESGDFVRRSPIDMATCFRLLDRGEVDFVHAPKLQGWMAARATLGADAPVRTLEVVLASTAIHLIAPKARADAREVLDTFNAGLAALRADGRYDAILDRHLDDLVPSTM
jgi:polar amino acid transport system substrate-binding protein